MTEPRRIWGLNCTNYATDCVYGRQGAVETAPEKTTRKGVKNFPCPLLQRPHPPLLHLPGLADVEGEPDLRPVRGGDELRRAAEDVPDGGMGGGRELGVGVVEQVEGAAAGRLQGAAVRGEEEEREGLALACRGDAAQVVPVPEDLELVAVGAEERRLAGPLALGHPFEGLGDDRRPFQTEGGRRPVADLDRRQAQPR